MTRRRPFGRAGAARPTDIAYRQPPVEQFLETGAEEVPGAHVEGLFLEPHDVLDVRIAVEHRINGVARERIQLFDPADGRLPVGTLGLLALAYTRPTA